MKIMKCLLGIDSKLQKSISPYTNTILAKLLVWLLSEIVLAIVVGYFVNLFNVYQTKKNQDAIEIKKINRIYVQVSDDYVESLFGTPVISIRGEGQMVESFYTLDTCVLRTVSDNNTVVAYFVTITSEECFVPLILYDDDVYNLGMITYDQFPMVYNHSVVIEANAESDGRFCYYGEKHGTGRWAMYNFYVLGNVAYGYLDIDSINLINSAGGFSGLAGFVDPEEQRKQTKPNTYGVIAYGYQDRIGVMSDNNVDWQVWDDLYYLFGVTNNEK